MVSWRLLLAGVVVLAGIWLNSQWTRLQTSLCHDKELVFGDDESDCTLLSTPTAVESLTALG